MIYKKRVSYNFSSLSHQIFYTPPIVKSNLVIFLLIDQFISSVNNIRPGEYFAQSSEMSEH